MSTTDRVAIVAGLRTPFAKQGSGLRKMRTVDLGIAVVKELIERAEIAPRTITLCVYGQVVPTLDWINIAREVVLGSGLPKDVDAFSVSRACATSLQAMTDAARMIQSGEHDVAIAGGADSMSDMPLGVSRPLRDALLAAQKGKTLPDKLRAFAKLSGKDVIPPVPGFAREPTTGELMGEAAEKMAKENGISRLEQDAIAHQSHVNAARAWSDGTFAPEVMRVIPPGGDAVTQDNVVRRDSTLESYAKLPPAFDRNHGTITAGNASPLTDGASALLLMRESKAKSLGYLPLGYLRSYAYAAVDPGWQLLMAPVFALPKALDRAGGLTLGQMELVDIHEAFAAQVASNLQAIASKKFAQEHLGRSEALGEIDPSRINVNGGSIALGHPFAATGARMVVSTLRELKKRKKQFGLLSVCAAGGLGAVVVLEAT
jgi:acetyl-CoA acyltransferase